MGSVHLSETRRLIGPPPFPLLSAGPLDDVPNELLLPVEKTMLFSLKKRIFNFQRTRENELIWTQKNETTDTD